MKTKLKLSALPHTWVIDLDGTIVKHNGYILDGKDTLLEGAKEFLEKIPQKDFILFVSSRTKEYQAQTLKFLREKNIRYNEIVFGLPYGERILLNDQKPGGLITSIAVCKKRNEQDFPEFFEDEEL